jgi:microcin C transport system substrate-binding protein
MFGRSDFSAEGTPTADELALLEPFRQELPAEVFGEAVVPPTSDGSGRDRKLLRQAADLLAAAGWRQQGTGLVDDSGTALDIEFLIDAAVFERVLTPYIANLKAIGIPATIRQVDPVQAEARQNDFDFDVVMYALSLTPTPLDGLDQMFSSSAADIKGSFNLAGVREKAIDAILEKLPGVDSREELITITGAIDRIFRAGYYWVPNWYRADHWVAHWDIFGWPAVKPDYAFTPETTWWFDRDKAAAIGMAG